MQNIQEMAHFYHKLHHLSQKIGTDFYPKTSTKLKDITINTMTWKEAANSHIVKTCSILTWKLRRQINYKAGFQL